jgi:hypothetical protein
VPTTVCSWDISSGYGATWGLCFSLIYFLTSYRSLGIQENVLEMREGRKEKEGRKNRREENERERRKEKEGRKKQEGKRNEYYGYSCPGKP